MARDEGTNVKASSTGANAGTLPTNDENQTPRQIVGRPEKSLSKKGDGVRKIAVACDGARRSDVARLCRKIHHNGAIWSKTNSEWRDFGEKYVRMARV